MTPDQEIAIEQLREVASGTSEFEVVSDAKEFGERSAIVVEVSVSCAHLSREAGGLPLRDRERIELLIDSDFPFSPPSVLVKHLRFAGHPHVNWGRCLCMYVAEQTEWNPAEGMYGFLRRLTAWLKDAAANELDPIGGAMHPPATYNTTGPMFIPRVDTPDVSNGAWIGKVDLDRKSEHRIDLLDWACPETQKGNLVGVAVLLNETMPLEFPKEVLKLLDMLVDRGADREQLFRLINGAASRNGEDRPLVFVVGTPMRGIRGETLKQHLTAWQVPSFGLSVLDLKSRSAELGEAGDEIHDKITKLFDEWAKSTPIEYCRVREDRPEVTNRRDIDRPMESFSGKVVEVWGCGAIGSHAAEWIVRSGVKKLVLRDNSCVSPGILVRQPFVDDDIGHSKAKVLAERLRKIYPSCEIAASFTNAVTLVNDSGFGEADIVIDATASQAVRIACERAWQKPDPPRPTIASLLINSTAEFGLAVMTFDSHSGCTFDGARRLKIECCHDDRLKDYADAFFPSEPLKPFQPEPGCSDATFIGSAVDVVILTGLLLNRIAKTLGGTELKESAFGFLVSSKDDATARTIGWQADQQFVDPQTNYETRVTSSAWHQIHGWTSRSRRLNGENVETGGLLFGERDDFLKIAWVSEADGPPPDSIQSETEFHCGVEGTSDVLKHKVERSRGAVSYVGSWHTHPNCDPHPSPRDFGAIQELLLNDPNPPKRMLLFIVSRPCGDTSVTASIFERNEFEVLEREATIVRAVGVQRSFEYSSQNEARPIGLSLSGGGSRAMAFHLGCLRAMHDRGILSKVDVISTISGGSVIGAMYAYSHDPFEDFELRVQDILRKGFVSSISRRLVLSHRLIQVLGTNLIAGTAAFAAFGSRSGLSLLERCIPKTSRAGKQMSGSLQPPLRRWYSRTSAFEKTLKDLLYGDDLMTSNRRDNLNVVVNACELRTGTAFRFGSRETGNSRFGFVTPNEIEVALAVAASAAFPVLLPAIDRKYKFTPLNGGEQTENRVVLTDGGVYENLGVTCMEPGRDPRFSSNVYSPEYIICCDAGPGQFDATAHPYGWATRMARSFSATHRQVQTGIQSRLHGWRQSEHLKGFVYSYLGQNDSRLPHKPHGLIPRSRVVSYPTDFSSMPQEDIDAISTRGEQLTRCLLEFYVPQL